MAGKIEILNPPGLGPAQGLYSQATHVPADVDTFHIAGQLAVGKDGSLIGVGDFDAQFHQVYGNLGDVLKALGEDYDSIIVMHTFMVHFAVDPAVHGVAQSAVSENLYQSRLSAEHAVDGRSIGEGRVCDRS